MGKPTPPTNRLPTIEELEAYCRNLPVEAKKRLDQLLSSVSVSWAPLPGPQRAAFLSKADILGYGGAAGAGKSDLILGIAALSHRRSVIYRRIFPSLRGMIDRSNELYGGTVNPLTGRLANNIYNDNLHRWLIQEQDGSQRVVVFDQLQYDKDARSMQGHPWDFVGYDEITEMAEAHFRYTMGWNRTTTVGQRCRAIATMNPPTSAEGRWVIDFWGPWLNDHHPRPAKPGELRWYSTVDGQDYECDGPDVVVIKRQRVKPKSRTFIFGTVQDNPYLLATDYVSTLQALPEPLRSMLLYGDFRAGVKDDIFQVIPTAWIDAAQQRWREIEARDEIPHDILDQLGVDVSRGGADKVILSPRCGNFFHTQVSIPGSIMTDGPRVASQVALTPLLDKTHTKIGIDVIGVGSSPYDALKVDFNVVAMNGAEGCDKARDKSGKLRFLNKRAMWYWRLREDLDPASGMDIALPPDPELKSDLCAVRWEPTVRGIKMMDKEDIKKMIGRSPDKGDSCVYAHAQEGAPAQGLFESMKQEYEEQQRKVKEEKAKGRPV